MAEPLGPRRDTSEPAPRERRFEQAKKKGCKKKKCSNWKGGKCRCGRD